MNTLVINGYKHISKPDAIIISQPFTSVRVTVTRQQFDEVLPNTMLPRVRNIVSMTIDQWAQFVTVGKAER